MPHAMTASRHIFCLATLYVCVACGAAPGESASRQPTTHTAREVKRSPSSHDWTRFGWDVGRSSVATDPTGITPENVATLRLQQVKLDGTVDASPIYLHDVRVNGAARNVFFVT